MTNKRRDIIEWIRDVRESGVWFVLVILISLGVVVGALDVVQWDKEFGKSILAEANAVLIDIFLIGIVIAIYDYRRRRRAEAEHVERELALLAGSDATESVHRKGELIGLLATTGQKPKTLVSYNLPEARLNGYDLSEIDMRFVVLKDARLTCAKFRGSDLLCADFSNYCAGSKSRRDRRLPAIKPAPAKVAWRMR